MLKLDLKLSWTNHLKILCKFSSNVHAQFSKIISFNRMAKNVYNCWQKNVYNILGIPNKLKIEKKCQIRLLSNENYCQNIRNFHLEHFTFWKILLIMNFDKLNEDFQLIGKNVPMNGVLKD